MKKVLAIIIILLMTLNMSMVGATQEIENFQNSDIEGHWGYEVMSKGINNGFISGYPDGTYRPDGKITKAEFLTIVNRVFGFYEISKENYDDIDINDWFSNQTSIARKNGYMDWYERDKLNPNNKITRQEVSAILTFINNIEKSNDLNNIQGYKDKLIIPKWSRGYIDAVVRKGYMKGYEDNTLRPDGEITRAEAVIMLDRVVGELINNEGTYGPEDETRTIDGNLTINTKDVILQNTIISGDLILAAGIKEGEVELKNVTIKGQTIINGGGENSITFTNCNVEELFVFKINGKIRVVSKDSNFVKAYLKSGGKLEGKYKGARVEILGKGQKVEFEGDFDEIIVESKALIEVTDDTQIDLLEISKEASDTQIDTDNKSEIKEIIFRGATSVRGKGKINKAIIEADGVTTQQRVYKRVVAKGIDGSGVKVRTRSSSSSTPPKDTTEPTPGDSGTLTTSAIGNDSVTLTWTEAEDNKTAQDNIKYIVYYSASDNIDTVANTKANGTPAGIYTSHIDTMKVTGLEEDTTYYFNVIVKDEAGNESDYTMISETTTSSTGSGTLEDPFIITCIEDLASIGRTDLRPDWGLDKHYILMNILDFDLDSSYNNPNDTSFGDINGDGVTTTGIKVEVTEGKGWKPVGVYENEFNGTFDGSNYAIKNLYINRGDASYQSLFGKILSNTIIKNLALLDATIISVTTNIGILVGLNDGGTIINCSSTGSVTGTQRVGGLIGWSRDGTITNCNSTANISAQLNAGGLIGKNIGGLISDSYASGTIVTTEDRAGGLIGENEESGTIDNCYALGDVTGTYHVGGLIGYNKGTISDSYSSGNITGNADKIGGLVGFNANDSLIENCRSTGNITAYEEAGGVAGYNYGVIQNSYSTGDVTTTWDYAGGIAGTSDNGDIQNCSSTGIITATGSVAGGIAGVMIKGTIKECFSTGVIQSTNYSAGGIFGVSQENGGLVQNCYSTGNITTCEGAGGIGGKSDGDGEISDCYSTGKITARDLLGGIVGTKVEGTIRNCYNTVNIKATGNSVGGIAGSFTLGFLQNCYNTGNIEGSGDCVGGIAGSCSYETLQNCYSTGNVKGSGNNAGGIAGGFSCGTMEDCYSTGEVSTNQYAGGIIGYAREITLNNSCAFNNSVKASFSAQRVVGYIYNDDYNISLSNNHAYEFMELSGSIDDSGISGTDIDNINNIGIEPLLSWDFDETDNNDDDVYWKLEDGSDRPVLYVDLDENGIFEKLGNDDGMLIIPSDITAPTPGNSGTLTTSAVGTNSITLSWTKAADNKTAQSNLEYLVYFSTSNNIDIVANIELNGIAFGCFTSDISTSDILVLSEGTTYYFNVIVKDEAGNKSAYTILSETTVTDVDSPTVVNPIADIKDGIVGYEYTLNIENVFNDDNKELLTYESSVGSITNCIWTYTSTTTENIIITITATDVAGNKVIDTINFSSNDMNIVIDENFENVAVGSRPDNWILKHDGHNEVNQKVIDGSGIDDSKCLVLDGASSWASELYYNNYNFIDSDYIVVEGYGCGRDTVDKSGRVTLANYNDGTWGTRYGDLIFDDDSLLYDDSRKLMTANNNQWYKFRLVYDLSDPNNVKESIIIDDILRIEDLSLPKFIKDEDNDVAYFELTGFNDNESNIIYFDNIKVWAIE